MSAFEQKSAGQPLQRGISASAWNSMLAAAQAYQRGKLDSDVRDNDRYPQAGIWYVKNSTSGDLDRFSVVGLSSLTNTPEINLPEFKNHPSFVAREPTADDANVFGVLFDAVKAGYMGRMVLDGVTPAQVNVTDLSHRFAVAETGTTANLVSAGSGSARVLWPPEFTETGVQWAVVRISNFAPPSVEAECSDDSGNTYTAADLVAAFATLVVDKCASLRLFVDDADPTRALLSIGGGPTDSIFWQGSAKPDCPQWHTSPSIARSMQLGVADPDEVDAADPRYTGEGFVRLGDTFPVYHLPPPSNGDQKIRWPTTEPLGVNAHLYVDALDESGKNIQTEWGAQGCDFEGYGYFGAACASLACTYVTIRRGIVTNIAGLSTNPATGDSGTVVCNVTPDLPFAGACAGTPVTFVSGTAMNFVSGQGFNFVSE